jgi:hypothetical protein
VIQDSSGTALPAARRLPRSETTANATSRDRFDNVEGMTLGPTLPDGRRSLILVSDHNFAGSQFTQFLLFALARS